MATMNLRNFTTIKNMNSNQNNIYFRSSGVGALMTEGKGLVLTEKQAETILSYQKKEKLTPNQSEELQRLISKRDAPPQLSDTAKRFIEETWLYNEKGFFEDMTNKYTDKGLYCEQDGLDLLSDLDGEFYIKNEERFYLGNLTGECDWKGTINGKKVIKDVKCAWNPKTFMSAEMTTLYEWQGRSYMHGYDCDEFHLEFCLVDCPPHVFQNEVWRLKNKYGIVDPETEEARPIFQQLETNLLYSCNSRYTKEERRKKFVITRDIEKEKQLLDKIPMAIEYYNTIKLNQF